MLGQPDSYKSLYDGFTWSIPQYYNIGVDICDRPADSDPHKTAIIDIGTGNEVHRYTFDEMRSLSNQLANALLKLGLQHQLKPFPDRVGVLLPQRFETAVAHIATLKTGCIAIPLFTLFGEEALLHRLRDSGAKVVITDRHGYLKLNALRSALPDLSCIISVDGAETNACDFSMLCSSESVDFNAIETRADDPALLIYTSGTTGNPKGALHAHRVLLGHLPGVEMAFNFLPCHADRFWTPADWAWIGGLLDVLMPSLHHGITVVAHRFRKFDPDAAMRLMKEHKIRNVFLPPTAIKLMRLHQPVEGSGIELRSIGSGGESLGPDLIDWCQHVLGASANEFYGQTECNMIVSSCSALEPATQGVMGRAVPGHRVDIVDDRTGEILGEETEGAIAVLSPDPVMFLEYWNNPQATLDKFIEGPDGQWLLTGDRGMRTSDGKLRFIGRDDDVISSAGYRIGPAEIENCLIRHPAVQLAGAVGKPDELRGSIVAVYLKLAEGFEGTAELGVEIASYVKTYLAAHEYPRAVRFLDEMPMTTTGKIIRARLRQLAREEYLQERAVNDALRLDE